jgi:prepilin-type N-terminal cleavage/methylation domain-containing protein
MSKLTKISQKNNQSGFTIIEVVLSLAIGAMIIGMVFIALPNLQKQRRDTARRNDLGKFMGQLEAFAGNNNGKYPSDNAGLAAFVSNYVTKDGAAFDDPKTGTTYLGLGALTTAATGASTPPPTGTVYYIIGAKCDPANPERALADATNTRSVIGMMGLERGVACQGNQ